MTYYEPTPVRARGVARDTSELRTVLVHFSRRLTDDELRLFHDYARDFQGEKP